jgi:hypothetical protein
VKVAVAVEKVAVISMKNLPHKVSRKDIFLIKTDLIVST